MSYQQCKLPLCLGKFLDLLAQGIEQNPHRLQPVDPTLIARACALTTGIAVDLDASLNYVDIEDAEL